MRQSIARLSEALLGHVQAPTAHLLSQMRPSGEDNSPGACIRTYSEIYTGAWMGEICQTAKEGRVRDGS